MPDGPALVDLRDGTRPTVVLPGNARETLVGFESKRKPARRRRGRWRRRALLLLPLLLAVAGFLVWDQVLAPVTAIPDVRGEPLEAAVATLEDAGFSTRMGDEPRYDLDVPADHVLVQDPTGEARRGSTVQLIVSAGPREHVLPPLTGEAEEDALAALDELNVEVDLRRSHHEQVPAGLVISTDPEPGRTIAEGATVVVVVSQGRQPIDVPDLRGGTLESARATAEELGLVVDVAERRYDDDVPEGVVITQRPDPGSVLFAGDAVEVVVSDGPEPFAVPNVEGETEERATAILQQAGLVVSVQYVDTIFPHREGKVDAQDPPPGSEVRPGDEVTIYVWR